MINKSIKVVSVMFALAVLTSLFACSGRSSINVDDKISYVSVACSHMCFDECYGISVSIDNGKAFLNGECFVDEKLTKLEDIRISDDELKTLNKLCNSLDSSLLKKEKERKSRIFVADETTFNFCVEWENGNTVNRSYIPEDTGSEIKDYLFLLMKKYK